MDRDTTRRRFLNQAAAGAAAAALSTADAAPAATPQPMPTIRLGKLEVSRLILGSNPFFGFDHGNPQANGDAMRKYYTPERIMAVMDQAADLGINAVWTPCYDHWIRLWNTYRERGGRLKNWIGQPDSFDHMKDHITACAKNGGTAIGIQGACIDRAFREKRHDLVREWLDVIKGLGLPAGIATHQPTTHLIAEEKKLPADYYHQCLYQPENYSPKCRDLALATVRKLDKPVVAYKVLAAGRLPARAAFTHLLKQLAPKDGLCVGMLPLNAPDQIAENAALVRQLSATA